MTFHVLALANTFESQFPHRSEYWWTQLPGNLDQACVCFSRQAWVDQLATCKDEESFLTTYQSFLETTWQALQGLQQCTGDFPYQRPTDAETRKAYYMKNRTSLHNQIVWGKGADEDQPVIPRQGEQSHQQQSTRRAASSAQTSTGKRGMSVDRDDDDPNERKSDANPPSKGDEAQDKQKKKEGQEATHDGGEQKEKTVAEQERDEALENVRKLNQQLKEAQDAARKAAEDKAQKAGEELVDVEKARKDKKREARREKKRRKKQKKDGQEGPPSDDEGESDDSDEKEEEEEQKKPEGESKEKDDKTATDKDKKPEGEEKSKDESNPEGEDRKTEGDSKPEGEESTTKEKESEKTEEGPPKDEESAETWAEAIRKSRALRQVKTAAADKANARTCPRPMCEADTKPNYVHKRAEHVPPRDPPSSDRWSVKDKPKVVPKRNPVQLEKDSVHKAIQEHGTRKRYSDFKTSVLQVLNAKKQTPPRTSTFALAGPDVYWVQTTIQIHEGGTLPLSELPGMHPRLYTFDKFWEIPKREEGSQLKGIALGVAQYVVGTLELESKRKAGTMKPYIDNEPLWLHMEVVEAARVLIKEVSAVYHQEDMEVTHWGHAFVYHPSEISFTRALQERFLNLESFPFLGTAPGVLYAILVMVVLSVEDPIVRVLYPSSKKVLTMLAPPALVELVVTPVEVSVVVAAVA